jgi:hypothetical protein
LLRHGGPSTQLRAGTKGRKNLSAAQLPVLSSSKCSTLYFLAQRGATVAESRFRDSDGNDGEAMGCGRCASCNSFQGEALVAEEKSLNMDEQDEQDGKEKLSGSYSAFLLSALVVGSVNIDWEAQKRKKT